MKDAVLFDLGNTLARYFDRAEFPAVLAQAIGQVQDHLRREGLLRVEPQMVRQRVEQEDHEAADYRVRSLEERLGRIFELPPDAALAACRPFLNPIFARGRLYEDTLPVLGALRARGVKTAIVSNTPWGSPGALWREELARLGLSPWVDAAIFCTDAGWRKPAGPIFDLAMARLRVAAEDCLFVGDDPRWDLDGPRALGIEAILIDRQGARSGSIRGLSELKITSPKAPDGQEPEV